jgi:phosphoacetylglucosamine mutase
MGAGNVLIAKTGVKHVHEAAHHNFDIGVYFEANGHGTVLFSDRVQDVLLQCKLDDRKSNAWKRLRLLPCLINPAVGDALSDLLLVDFILQAKEWGISEWNNNLYQDLPSRQLKVQVKDRSTIRTNDNETRCLQPLALQTALDSVMKKVNGRAFVRPSGTENVVRVYAEASSRKDADWLAIETARLVYKHCHGVGTLPSLPSKL